MDTKEVVKRFMSGQLGMDYHGRPLSSKPRNTTLALCRLRLRGGRPLTVELEPGDATRYVLTFLPVHAAGMEAHGYAREDMEGMWMVLRDDGRGGFIGTLANVGWDFAHHNLGQLARGNEHTADVIVAWVSQMFSAVRA